MDQAARTSVGRGCVGVWLLLTGCPEPSDPGDHALTYFGADETSTGDGDTGPEAEPAETGADEPPIPDMPDEAPPNEVPLPREPVCGDFGVSPGEACDGWNLAFASCMSLGYAGGQLGCNDDCSFDESACIPHGCGNGVLEILEVCDGAPYPCWMLGYAGAHTDDGLASCGLDCQPDESACKGDCDWGQPGCFCTPTDECVDGYECVPHRGFVDAPGTCMPPHDCANRAEPCTIDDDCCSGACVDGACSVF